MTSSIDDGVNRLQSRIEEFALDEPDEEEDAVEKIELERVCSVEWQHRWEEAVVRLSSEPAGRLEGEDGVSRTGACNGAHSGSACIPAGVVVRGVLNWRANDHRVPGEKARAHATAAGPGECAGAREARVLRPALEAGTRGGARATDSRPRTAAGGSGKPRSGSQDGRIFYKLSEQTERHNHERIAHEREENNNDRNLMTYNVHIDNWTKKCMVQCFGTFSCWDMSSEHIVQAVEFNRDARVTDSDMENFADAIATGSNPMRLTDGSTKIVLDNNILSVFERHRRA
ncbi:hypothetical protein PC120_g5162 [Phytophthora cactorum]|nr:hypothetical protein PC120_g5162 [Phytophthora cactorum]